MAEVKWFHVISMEANWVANAIQGNERIWGELATAKLGCIQCLEMADTLAWIKDQDDGLLDNMLRMMKDFPSHDKLCGHSNLKRG